MECDKVVTKNVFSAAFHIYGTHGKGKRPNTPLVGVMKLSLNFANLGNNFTSEI